MRINNYRGMVADQPIDTAVVEPTAAERRELPVHKPNFMDNVLSHLNNNNNVVPAGSLPVYNKGC